MTLPLKKQVANKKLSKRLEELGYPQESLWYWTKNNKLNFELKLKKELTSIVGDGWTWLEEAIDKGYAYSAPTASELGQWLMLADPDNLKKFLGKIAGWWNPDFLAKTLIYLIENKLIKLCK